MRFRPTAAVAGPLVALIASSIAMTSQAAPARLCVRPNGAHGCYSTIQAAVNAAMPHDVIRVYNGVYTEDVVIGKPLTLVGQGSAGTIIDAHKLSNGIFIDGLDYPGISDVSISNFTVRRANFEGIVATNAARLVISANVVENNDKGLNFNNEGCPGIPIWETDEHFDCGEGIHISGVVHSTVADNYVHGNSGGILISDDTAKNESNVITNNVSESNPYDCGIVLASHPPSAGSTAPHHGVVGNLVSGNTSIHNGYLSPGEGAGIGMFSDGTGPGRVTGNIVINNVAMKNGLPGVILQSHANFDNMSHNAIMNNQLSGNGSLGQPATTGISIYSALGPSHMEDTVVSGNTITNQMVDIAVDTVGTKITLRYNNLLGGTAGATGVYNYGTGAVDAGYNWWGCTEARAQATVPAFWGLGSNLRRGSSSASNNVS